MNADLGAEQMGQTHPGGDLEKGNPPSPRRICSCRRCISIWS
jgi:hypothetical protein